MSSDKSMFYCGTCAIQLNSQVQYDDHMVGKSHLKKLKKALESGTSVASTYGADHQAAVSPPAVEDLGYSTGNPESYDCVDPSTYGEVSGTKRKLGLSNYPCAVCELEFNSDFQAQEHFKGAKHAKKLNSVEEQNIAFRSQYGLPPPMPSMPKAMKTAKPNIPSASKTGKAPLTEGLYCSFCNMYLNSPGQLAAHRTGNKHLANLQKMKGQSQGETTTSMAYSCTVCNVTLTGAANYKKHMNSKAHQDREMAQTISNAGQLTSDGASYPGDEDGGPGDFPVQENIWEFDSNSG